MDKFKIKVIISTTREGRTGDKVGKWTADLAKKHSEFDIELLDLREYPMPFFDEPVSPSYITEPYKNEHVAKWTKKIAEADGYIIVTAEYNHGYPAVLKNALDYVYHEWNNKPVAFVAYGSVGGARAVEQLRQVAVELQMTPTRSAVHIPAPWNLMDDKGNMKLDDFVKPAEGMLEQFSWWVKALKTARG